MVIEWLLIDTWKWFSTPTKRSAKSLEGSRASTPTCVDDSQAMSLAGREGEAVILSCPSGWMWLLAIDSYNSATLEVVLMFERGEQGLYIQDIITCWWEASGQNTAAKNHIRCLVIVVREDQRAEIYVVRQACRSINLDRACYSVSILGREMRVCSYLVQWATYHLYLLHQI